MNAQDRKYDIVLFGATGFTGALAAEYIASNAPTSLKWAIAGRSEAKLQNVKNEVKKKGGNRVDVETMVVQLDKVESLQQMASSTKVVVTTVGPYCRYGSPLVEACAKSGTHYVDCTGEHVWVLEMIEKYHDLARKNGAIIVPQCAFESAPADLSAYTLAKTIREKLNAKTGNMRFSLAKVKGTASGGTIETALSVLDVYSLRQMAAASRPLALSPVPRRYAAPWVLPVFSDPHLGTLTNWVQAVPDRAIVMRSWGLMAAEGEANDRYGENFTFEEYTRVRGRLAGLALWSAIALGSLALVFPPIRWLVRKVVTQPGSGPSLDNRQKGKTEWQSVANVDDGSGKKVMCNLKYTKGDAYMLTALFIVEAALAMLYDTEGSLASKMGGGVLTPASLGDGFVSRLEKAGVEIDTKIL